MRYMCLKWLIATLYLSCFLKCLSSAPRKSYAAGGMHGLTSISPECEKFLRLPYKPSASVKDKFRAYGTRGFVFVSTHRTSDRSFAVVGLGARSVHKKWAEETEGCLWISLNGPKGISGKLKYIFPGEHHDLTYEVVIMSCELKESTPDNAGGALFIGVQGEDILALKEEPGRKIQNPSGPFPHKLTFCSSPINHRIHQGRILQSLTYLRGIGADHFVLYDSGGLDEGFMSLARTFVTANELEIVDFKKQHLYDVWHPVVTNNECVYRTRYTSEWVLMHEFDDFLSVPPSLSLGQLLEENKDKPWLTFGTRIWAIEFCRPPNEGSPEWPLERMIYCWPSVFCSGESKFDPNLCLSHYGLRRYIINPRKVNSLEIHRVLDAESGGVNVNASSFIIQRFSGYSAPNALLCDSQVVKGKEPEWWVQDTSFEPLISKAKEVGLKREH